MCDPLKPSGHLRAVFAAAHLMTLNAEEGAAAHEEENGKK
jgi:hypothetical protein